MLLTACLATVLAVEPSPVVTIADAPTYAIAEGKGRATLLFHAGTGQPEVAVSHLELQPGAAVPEHTHEASETLVVQQGECSLTLGGTTSTLKAGQAVSIPRGVKHAAKVSPDAKGSFVAVQIYAPAGAEQRFTKGKRLEPAAKQP